MVTGQLPIIKIDGQEYFMDVRLKEYRRILKKGESGGFTIKKFNEISGSNKIELVSPRQMLKNSDVISCLTIREYDELYDLGIKKKILKTIPICSD